MHPRSKLGRGYPRSKGQVRRMVELVSFVLGFAVVLVRSRLSELGDGNLLAGC